MLWKMRWMILLVVLGIATTHEASAKDKPSAEATRSAFLKLLDRPKVPADVQVESSEVDPKTGFQVERLSIASEKKSDGTIERVPILIVEPKGKSGRLPAVIALHGTGGNAEGMRSTLEGFAKRGFVGIAIDARYHGRRVKDAKGATAYVEAITKAWRSTEPATQEHPFYYDTCWDLWRTIDYLETRPDIDPKRIGMLGVSMGGIETWLAASVDERVAVAVPAISVQSFRWSLDNGEWGGRAATIKGAHDAAAKDLGHERVDAEVCRALWTKLIPGILDAYDCPAMLELFAGRPLLIVNGEKDPNCPIEGAKLALGAAESAYHAAGVDDHLKIDVASGVAHAVTEDQWKAIFDWFERWLKP